MIQDSEMAVKKMSKPRRLKYSTWLGRIAERVAKEELKKRGYKFGDIGAHGRRTGIEIWECKECKPVGEQIHQCPYGRTVEKCPFGEKWFKLAKYAQGVMAHVQVERTARTWSFLGFTRNKERSRLHNRSKGWLWQTFERAKERAELRERIGI